MNKFLQFFKNYTYSIMLLFSCVLLAPEAADCQTILYVTPTGKKTNTGQNSWSNATTLTQALLNAPGIGPNVQIWVATGGAAGAIYTPTSNAALGYTTFSIPSGVKLYGGFSGNEKSIAGRKCSGNTFACTTTLSASNARGSNIITIQGEGNVINGFTLQGQKNTNTSSATSNTTSGAMVIASPNNVIEKNDTVENCIFENNNVSSNAITGANAGSAILYLVYVNGGAIYIGPSMTAVILNSVFENNKATLGGAIYCKGNMKDSGCYFIQDTGVSIPNTLLCPAGLTYPKGLYESIPGNGAAIYISAGSTKHQFVNCAFILNSSTIANNVTPNTEGGAIYFSGATNAGDSIVNCIFCGNQAQTGGAIGNAGSNLNIYNCTFYANEALSNTFAGGAISIANKQTVNIVNNTFYDNENGITTPDDIYPNPSNPTIPPIQNTGTCNLYNNILEYTIKPFPNGNLSGGADYLNQIFANAPLNPISYPATAIQNLAGSTNNWGAPDNCISLMPGCSSPAIGAGTTTTPTFTNKTGATVPVTNAISPPSIDFSGNSRNGRNDIGAFQDTIAWHVRLEMFTTLPGKLSRNLTYTFTAYYSTPGATVTNFTIDGKKPTIPCTVNTISPSEVQYGYSLSYPVSLPSGLHTITFTLTSNANCVNPKNFSKSITENIYY